MPDNSVTLVGNVTRDPELRFTNTGQPTASFGLAVNRRWQNRQTQEWEEATSFFDVVCWREMAENVSESLTRGARVVVAGRLEQRSWETPDGDAARRSRSSPTRSDRRCAGRRRRSRRTSAGARRWWRPRRRWRRRRQPAPAQPSRADAGGRRVQRGAFLMARSNYAAGRARRAPKDLNRRVKKKPCALCRDHIEWVDYKDVPLLRKYMSDRGKIRSRRVTGNCAQHQRDIAHGHQDGPGARPAAVHAAHRDRAPGGRGGRGDRGDRGDRGGDRGDRGGRGPRSEDERRPTGPGAGRGQAGRRATCRGGRRGGRDVASVVGRAGGAMRADEGRPARRRRRRRPARRHRRRRRRLRPQLPPARGAGDGGHRGREGQAAAMRRGRDLREAKDREAAEAQAQALAGAALRLEARARLDRPALRFDHRGDVAEAVTAQKGVGLDRTRSGSTSRSRRSGPTRCRSTSSPTLPRRDPRGRRRAR